MTILSRTEQKGRSMVEMLGVLAIIGVLSVGGISGYSKAMAKYKLTKAQDQITMLLMNIRTAYATSPNYSGLDSQAVVDYHIAPGDMISGNNLFGAFGPVDVAECDAAACGVLANANALSSYFYIKMSSLGVETCMSLASSDWGSDGLAGLIVSNAADPYGPGDLPLDLATAITACEGAAGDQTSADITWVYY